MLTPFPLLRKLQISSREKAILVLIFLLPLFVIAFAILRLVETNSLSTTVDPVRLALFSTVEVSCCKFLRYTSLVGETRTWILTFLQQSSPPAYPLSAYFSSHDSQPQAVASAHIVDATRHPSSPCHIKIFSHSKALFKAALQTAGPTPRNPSCPRKTRFTSAEISWSLMGKSENGLEMVFGDST